MRPTTIAPAGEYSRSGLVDNLKTPDTGLVHDFGGRRRHLHLHLTPTHPSWLNQVELFFSYSNAGCYAAASSTRSTT